MADRFYTPSNDGNRGQVCRRDILPAAVTTPSLRLVNDIQGLQYDITNDARVMLPPVIQTLSSGRDAFTFSISALTCAGASQKPNEDAFRVMRDEDNLVASAFDGVTNPTTHEELKGMSGARFASHFLVQMLQRVMSPHDLKSSALALNIALRDESLKLPKANITLGSTLPASTGILLNIDAKNRRIDLCYAGDSFAIFQYKNGRTELMSFDANLIHDTHTLGMISGWAKRDNLSFRAALQAHARQIGDYIKGTYDIKLNPLHPEQFWDGDFGVGVFNGQPSLCRYLMSDGIDRLDDVAQILIGTDGIVPYSLSETTTDGRKAIFLILSEGGLPALYARMKEDASSDPEFEQYIRYKDTDDATGIYIKIA